MGWVGMGWGTDNVPVDATQLTALRGNRKGQRTQHVMKIHVGWVGMGWDTDNVPVDATQLTALRSNRRGQGTQHVMKMLGHIWVGWGWGGALITFLLMLRKHSSTQQPQGTRYATCDEDARPHMGWVGMGWGTDNVPVDATQFNCWMVLGRFSINCFQ